MRPDKPAVFIVCDQKLTRLGITSLINQHSDLELTGSVRDYREALPLLRDHPPKVLVLIAHDTRMEIPIVVFRLKVASPQARLLVIAEVGDASLVRQILKAGASGYVRLSAPLEDLIRAIRSLAGGGSYIDPELIVNLVSSFRPRQTTPPEEQLPLSRREEEVLRFVVGGCKSREIADRLHISSKTVDTHCARALKKLSLHHRKDVVRYGISRGWLTEEPED